MIQSLLINCNNYNNCNKLFLRKISYINGKLKRNCKLYCSRRCSSIKAVMGQVRTIEQKSRMSIAQTGNKNAVGHKHTIEAKEKIRLSKLGKKRKSFTEEHKSNLSKSCKREKNGGWKGGITPQNKLERSSVKNEQFIKEILELNNYTCQICNGYGGKLSVDHIMPWSLYPKLRQDPDNVRVLCEKCHKKYGAKPHCRSAKWAISPISRSLNYVYC